MFCWIRLHGQLPAQAKTADHSSGVFSAAELLGTVTDVHWAVVCAAPFPLHLLWLNAYVGHGIDFLNYLWLVEDPGCSCVWGNGCRFCTFRCAVAMAGLGDAPAWFPSSFSVSPPQLWIFINSHLTYLPDKCFFASTLPVCQPVLQISSELPVQLSACTYSRSCSSELRGPSHLKMVTAFHWVFYFSPDLFQSVQLFCFPDLGWVKWLGTELNYWGMICFIWVNWKLNLFLNNLIETPVTCFWRAKYVVCSVCG